MSEEELYLFYQKTSYAWANLELSEQSGTTLKQFREHFWKGEGPLPPCPPTPAKYLRDLGPMLGALDVYKRENK